MSRLGFRTRLLLVLMAFAVLPAAALTTVGLVAANQVLPFMASGGAWTRVAETGSRALSAARGATASPEAVAALDAHEAELQASLDQAKRLEYLAPRVIRPVLVVVSVLFLALALIAANVAGHLSRQLSRPLDEVVEWTERIARAEAVPSGPPSRGAPEFDVLRSRMRTMAMQLDAGRKAATEAARLGAFRETARRVAHELKNPLTPIRFAVSRLRQSAAPELQDTIDVLETETQRLDTLAKNFAQFGRLPDGPVADIDIAELLRYATRATLSPTTSIALDLPDSLPFVSGHHDPLARAVSNILLNAADAAGPDGTITVSATALETPVPSVRIAVHDTGPDIAPDALRKIWEPYVTTKPGGTGLGLAIVRQTVLAHGGSVDAASERGRGTTISLTLPCVGVSTANDTPA
ncbi:MAG: HAMP domain-containing histidine kinase [Gemmatimonadaceae bacterium]|nr:HAMP domain-containing histidine kinase [Gemmatimonadaceae bacterium]